MRIEKWPSSLVIKSCDWSLWRCFPESTAAGNQSAKGKKSVNGRGKVPCVAFSLQEIWWWQRWENSQLGLWLLLWLLGMPVRSAKVMQEVTVALQKKKKKKWRLINCFCYRELSKSASLITVFSPVCWPIIQPLNGPVGFFSRGEKKCWPAGKECAWCP